MHPTRRTCLIRSACLAGIVLIPSLAFGQDAKDANTPAKAPLMKLLPRFEVSSVPAMSPEEVEPPNFHPGAPQPDGLPGNGMAQHPMLYIGEGYNKMFMVNHGKIVWTYSTGPGNEYDDVWMLSNGNILFTRMQYIAEITPEKKVVWRYDAPAGTEIHACQPIGKDKVLFIVNGLPPKLMVVNIKTHAVLMEHVLPALSQTDQSVVHPAVSSRPVYVQGNLPVVVPEYEPSRRVRQEFQRNLVLRHCETMGGDSS